MKNIIISLVSTVTIAFVVGCAFNSKKTEINNSEQYGLVEGVTTTVTTSTLSPARGISSVENLDQFNVHMPPLFQMVGHNRKLVVVFWISICDFCTTELERLNQLVVSGQVPKDSILAIAIGKTELNPRGDTVDTVTAAVQQRGYRFRVALDQGSIHSGKFHVRGTPTIIFADADGTVEDKIVGSYTETTGRILDFINSTN